jgi:hypothetical protein
MVRVQPSRRGTEPAALPTEDRFVRRFPTFQRRGSVSHQRFLPLVLGIFCAGIFDSRPVRAGDGFQPVTSDELKMSGDPKAPGAPAIILFRQVDRDDDSKTAHQFNYLKIKILSEEGRKYADVEIPFYRSEGNIVNVRARTTRPDGSVVNFDGKVYEKSIVKAKGLKYLAKTFKLPDVEVGSVIEYFYTQDLSERFIYDSHWILSQELFTKQAKFSLKPYVRSYNNISVRWSWQGLPVGTVEPKEGPDRVVRLETQNIPAFQAEDFMPPENELKARVDFIYSEDLPENDLNKFWRKVGKRLDDKVESFVGKRKSMEQAVAQIVAPGDSPEVKLQKIYARVQQLRNTSYEIRKTEQEQKRDKEKEATNVEDLWKAGYGERRDITWLYLALVRAAGFEAYPVWASDRRNYFFNPNLFDSSKLNANMVLVKLNGEDIYCDPGAAFTPFGLLPWPETSVTGLRLDKDGGTWITTTLPESTESRVERKAVLKLSEATGGLEGKLTVTFSGLEALERRLEERNADEADRKVFLEEQVKEYIPAAIEVELTRQPDWNSSARMMVAEFDLKVPGWASNAGRRALLQVGLFGATEKHLFEHADRVHPIYFQYPFQKIDDISIELPMDWQVSTVPPPQNNDAQAVAYTLKVENGKGTLHLHRTLNVDVLALEAKYYTVLRNFFHLVKIGDEQQIVLQPGSAAAKN